ncbi:hypothetical protein D1007_04756 [Hordeum vulgare]|uniref:Uncharacterized protein n=1 Tax=Hordeum vulgare subsp. vulgare TaxID=112509 RepID=A0A8I7B1F8_HORVV|nr:uncharacterized protein LOC123416050 [Hordeum vulgare subsp. vulgare]KAE8817649.1 hypothetical protein D1007_04756 [Hordeum vulgare]KAI5019443.1 hypothetical protein ZWY2020_044331 [Hordeum vulgare]
MDMSADQYHYQHEGMEEDGVGRGEQVPAPAAVAAKKLWRMVRAVHLVLVRGLGKHQPKIAALGVNLHHLLSSSKRHHHHHLGSARGQDPAFTTYLAAALSCQSMDPGAAVHPYPRGRGAHGGRGGASSLSCRSMDPGAAVCQQYQYRPRDVEFSCSTTPLHRRRRGAHRHRSQSQHGDLPEHTSAPAVKTLFELMDDDMEEEDVDVEGGTVPWAAGRGPAPRQVRITDSPFQAREEDDEEGRKGVVDRRADEFIVWFHDQLRMQQQQQRPAARDRATRCVR